MINLPTKKKTIKELAEAKKELEKIVDDIFDKMKEYDEKYEKILNESHFIDSDLRRHCDIKRIKKELNRSFWTFTNDSFGYKKYMTAKKQDEFNKQIYSDNIPDFNVNNVTSTFINFKNNFNDNIINFIKEVWESLKLQKFYANKDYRRVKKMNNFKVEKVFRTSLGICWDNYFNSFGFGTFGRSSTSNKLFDDFENALKIIDGKFDHENNYNIFSKLDKYKENILETDYFTIQLFMNGNQKVKIKDCALKLLNDFNLIGSGEKRELPQRR